MTWPRWRLWSRPITRRCRPLRQRRCLCYSADFMLCGFCYSTQRLCFARGYVLSYVVCAFSTCVVARCRLVPSLYIKLCLGVCESIENAVSDMPIVFSSFVSVIKMQMQMSIPFVACSADFYNYKSIIIFFIRSLCSKICAVTESLPMCFVFPLWTSVCLIYSDPSSLCGQADCLHLLFLLFSSVFISFPSLLGLIISMGSVCWCVINIY